VKEALIWTKYQPPPAGPAVCFLAGGADGTWQSAAVPADPAQLREAYAEVAARGPVPTWAQWCRHLVRSCTGAPYAGTWQLRRVPDDLGPHDALALVRSHN
jgi:hypothetical protein